MRPANIRPGYCHGMTVTPEFIKWRDELRNWRWVMDDCGTYQRVEDK